MHLSLKALIGPRVQAKAIDLVPSGLPVRLSVAISSPSPNMPGAALELAKRHMPLGQAHRLMTKLVQGEADLVAEVPMVENTELLVKDLARCGIEAMLADPPATINVRAIRKRAGLSQDQFALAYGLDVATVRNWEQGRTSPDLAARNYLLMIDADPSGMRHRLLESIRNRANDAKETPTAIAGMLAIFTGVSASGSGYMATSLTPEYWKALLTVQNWHEFGPEGCAVTLMLLLVWAQATSMGWLSKHYLSIIRKKFRRSR